MKFRLSTIFLLFAAAVVALVWYVNHNNRNRREIVRGQKLMNESTEYILNSVKSQVWSGFYTPTEVDEMVDELADDDPEADTEFLHKATQSEFAKKKKDEATWPATTDCDKLDRAFEQLNSTGIIALHNTGYTMSDGLGDVSEALESRDRKQIKGYCFYHGQDLERAVDGAGLMITFGSFDDDKNKKLEVGSRVKEILQNSGFDVEWNGDSDHRLNILNLDWKLRGKQ